MQKTLASVDGCWAPSAMHPAGVPVSSMCAPSAKVKAPLWLCSQLVKAPLVQSLSALQGLGGFSKAPPPGTRQKGQKTRTLEMPAPVWNASLLAVPVVNEKEIGRGPMSANTSGGQSWLVGYALVALQVSVPGQSLGTAPTRQNWVVVLEHLPRFELPGVQGAPWFGPPLHLLVVGLQIGQGWMAGSFTHVPPGQLTFETQLKPAMPPAVEALQRFCWTSPPPGRNTSELRGRLTLAAPAQLPVPVALWARL